MSVHSPCAVPRCILFKPNGKTFDFSIVGRKFGLASSGSSRVESAAKQPPDARGKTGSRRRRGATPVVPTSCETSTRCCSAARAKPSGSVMRRNPATRAVRKSKDGSRCGTPWYFKPIYHSQCVFPVRPKLRSSLNLLSFGSDASFGLQRRILSLRHMPRSADRQMESSRRWRTIQHQSCPPVRPCYQ
jgi:hypothetical protein